MIVGGGLAGLALAIQLKQRRPETSLCLIERRGAPAPEAAFKVGESFSLLPRSYFDSLGLAEHFRERQILKPSARFFMTSGDNSDITRRVEVGPSAPFPNGGYQVDRGRLENHLLELVRELDVTVLDGHVVRALHISRDGHRVDLERGTSIGCRWLVDASGRVGLLRRKLKLGRKVGHRASSAWFRLAAKVDVGEWSGDPSWRERGAGPDRYLSTVHLMGRGYWVWLIPLSSGSTSIGIVAEERHHPFTTFNTFERALAWLGRHEPQCAAEVEPRRHLLQDFKVMNNFAYGCERFFSADRWALTGESGAFTDPLFSPGGDFIAIGNTMVTDLISRDLDHDPGFGPQLEAHNENLRLLFDGVLRIYQDQYAVMGNAAAWIAKEIWDTCFYWTSYATFFMHGVYGELGFMLDVATDLYRLEALDKQMQVFFREWAEIDRREWSDGYVDTRSLEFMVRLNSGLNTGLDPPQLAERFERDVDFMEQLATAIQFRALTSLDRVPAGGRLDPFEPAWSASRIDPAAAARLEAGVPADVMVQVVRLWPAPAEAKLAN